MSDVSIKVVASLAGVSIATVSRTLNQPDTVTESTRLKVEDAIRRTGYRPNRAARSLRKGHSNHFLVALPSVGHPHLTELIRDIRAAAQASNYSISVAERRDGDLDVAEAGAIIASRQADGVILVGSNTAFVQLGAGRQRSTVVLPAVTIDNFAAAGDATRLLLEHGHKRIGMISGHRDSSVAHDRESGYLEALGDAGLPADATAIEDGDYTIAGAREATRRLLNRREAPTAIFCASDEMAIGCIHELKTAGLLVPADVSVVGFDDIRYAAVCDPPLTTVRQPTGQIGSRIVNQLIDALTTGERPGDEQEAVRHELVQRCSVAAAPQ